MTRILASLGFLLFLSGCAAGGIALGTAADVAQAGRLLVNENIADRQSVRAQCRSILEQEVAALRSDGKADEALALLRRHYPRLITEKIAEKVIAALEAGAPVSLPPDICGPGDVASTVPKPQ